MKKVTEGVFKNTFVVTQGNSFFIGPEQRGFVVREEVFLSATFYPYVGAFIWISILLVCGAFLRNKLPFLQHKLIPSSLIGGVIGFVLLNTGLIGMPTAEGWMAIPPKVFGVMVFHLFAFGFVGIGLLQQDKKVARKKPLGCKMVPSGWPLCTAWFTPCRV
ncbi:hypothetical protein [Desulfoluna limicola]|uniref:hypothetical protein n=1 Tax=Desulfoluna limicola TaxID=2810562 RepID=UPI001F286972|nr:hypothetical protein [Desulfoluna limicola]